MKYIVNIPVLSLYNVPYGEKTDEILHGMAFDVMEKQGRWKRIKTEYGYEGWVLEENEGQIQKREIWMEEFPKIVVTAPWLDVILHPNIRSKVVRSIPRGALLFWMGEKEDGRWYCIRLPDGQYGWIRKEGVRFWEKKEIPSIKRNEEWIRNQIVEDAKQYKNIMYRWAGKTPYGVDCSGFCSIVYWMSGLIIYRDAKMKEGFFVHLIEKESLLPGDLLYYPGHMALYLGNETYIHASTTAGKVTVNSLNPLEKSYREDLSCPQLGSVF